MLRTQRVAVVDYLVSRALHPAVQALLLGLLAAAFVLVRKPRTALVLGLVAVAWVWVASSPAVALRLRQGLVPATAAPAADTPRADAIVVLGGGAIPMGSWIETGSRAGIGLSLWQEGYAPVVLVSGSDQARTLAAGYVQSGVPMADLRVEATSRNTHENARNAAAMLRSGGLTTIVLVTSPIHMRRATASFRHEGLQVAPAPADDDDHEILAAASGWLPRREALTMTARCLREYVALWIYTRRGWI
ncbi:YdcF family protein [Luteibacter aegosomatissinici]|uniref:YdcF family protein n=1 Tax=Luteibacter aegosomatissinici TaxID=2911539 RepID=UPI001FF91364|nr:YdcF family protein [Luteibacter aegosomatissinici]UPG96405.1 YdcF family protein [Luteibacter aegosomatissinici]